MKKLNLDLYKKMYLIRRAEEKIQELYPADDMKTPMHMSMGEEAIVAGVVQALSPCDQVLGTYRSHGLYLAKTMETDQFFAEMFGKRSGCARGKAGSMHLSAPKQGLLCCSAIVGSSIPVAMGAAFANKFKSNRKIVAVFFGDGATDGGVFWETINFSGLKKLPILFICEDNGFAVHTPRDARQSFKSDAELFSSFGLNVFEQNSTDPAHIYETTRQAVKQMRETERPCFLRLHYYRYLEHVGIYSDFDSGYRSKAGFDLWFNRDPLKLQREKLLQMKVAKSEIESLESALEQQLLDSIEFARKSLFPDAKELYEGVFVCE